MLDVAVRAGSLHYEDLATPASGQLRAVFGRLLDVVVARDSRSTRSEEQLNELCNLLLLKLESDLRGERAPAEPVLFQPSSAGEAATGLGMREQFAALSRQRPELFGAPRENELALDDDTITEAVSELCGFSLLSVRPEAISAAFQLFRQANLKAGEGQYFTPQRIISTAVKMMDIQPEDKIIDPACGTGGFLVEAFLRVVAQGGGERTWAHARVYGVDRDTVSVKLARALMTSLGGGPVSIYAGDSIRAHCWAQDYPHLDAALADGSFSVVITNPPFGKNLKVSRNDSRSNSYSVAAAAAGRRVGGGADYADTEIGLVFMERAYRLLLKGGRLGIILPETYFFSSSYRWLPGWLDEHFVLRGFLNIPMEAFQSFCRAKTNFYIFEKI